MVPGFKPTRITWAGENLLQPFAQVRKKSPLLRKTEQSNNMKLGRDLPAPRAIDTMGL